MSYKLKLIIKSTVALIVFVILSTIFTYYEPSIGANFAVNQLQDTYSSTAQVKMWSDFKNGWGLFYVLFLIILFFVDIKKLTNKNK